MSIKCTKPTKPELEDIFGRNVLQIPDELAEKIRKYIGKTPAGNFCYLIQSVKKGCITYACLQDPIYNNLTAMKSSIQCIKDGIEPQKFKEMLNRNKKDLLSKIQELHSEVSNKSIMVLDLNEKDTKTFLTGLNILRGYMGANSYKNLIKSAENLKQFYQDHKNFCPEENIEDTKTLIALLKKKKNDK